MDFYTGITSDFMKVRCQISKSIIVTLRQVQTTTDCGILKSMRYLGIPWNPDNFPLIFSSPQNFTGMSSSIDSNGSPLTFA